MDSQTSNEAPQPNLRVKLADIRRRIHNIEKRGYNEFHKYEYVMAADIAGVLGTELAQHNIIIQRRNLAITRSQVEKDTVVELSCEYGFIDGDSDEQIWQPAYGEGRDRGDKAAYKAFTGALKYFLIQVFLLASGDDPENEHLQRDMHEPDHHIDDGNSEDINLTVLPTKGVLKDYPRVAAIIKPRLQERFLAMNPSITKQAQIKALYPNWPESGHPDDISMADLPKLAEVLGMELTLP